MPTHLLALDQGTTSSRATVFDAEARFGAVAQQEFAQHSPRPVEHDAGEIWQTQRAVAREALQEAGLGPADLAAIGITNQHETDETPASRSVTPSSGRTAARPPSVNGSSPRASKTTFGGPPASAPTPTFPGRSCRGCSRTSRARGAALLAGLAADVLDPSTGSAQALDDEERERLVAGWHRAVERTRGWAREDGEG